MSGIGSETLHTASLYFGRVCGLESREAGARGRRRGKLGLGAGAGGGSRLYTDSSRLPEASLVIIYLMENNDATWMGVERGGRRGMRIHELGWVRGLDSISEG